VSAGGGSLPAGVLGTTMESVGGAELPFIVILGEILVIFTVSWIRAKYRDDRHYHSKANDDLLIVRKRANADLPVPVPGSW